MLQCKEWYSDWFNSPYYHLLYSNRNDTEAHFFIDNLLNSINLKPNSKVLDLACGKGRHSVYLSKKGFQVTGVDLSLNNICEASKQENSNLNFFNHDMRKVFRINHFDAIVNMFTSFGYFETENENEEVIQSCYKGLNSKGKVVIDFFNLNFVKNKIVPFEEKKVSNIVFKIEKKIENNFIIKNICVVEENKEYHFQEKVMALEFSHFQKYLEQNGFNILNLFGDYSLNKFEPNNSERLIIVAEKTT